MNRSGETATRGRRVRVGHTAAELEEGERSPGRCLGGHSATAGEGRADAPPHQPPRQASAHAAQAHQVTHPYDNTAPLRPSTKPNFRNQFRIKLFFILFFSRISLRFCGFLYFPVHNLRIHESTEGAVFLILFFMLTAYFAKM